MKDNCWLTIGLREGKNREIKRVLEHLGLQVGRLIRLSFGPFQLADLAEGEVREIRGRVLRDQLGARLIEAAGADFDAPLRNEGQAVSKEKPKPKRASGGKTKTAQAGFVSAKDARALRKKASDKKNSGQKIVRSGDARKPASGRPGQRNRPDGPGRGPSGKSR